MTKMTRKKKQYKLALPKRKLKPVLQIFLHVY